MLPHNRHGEETDWGGKRGPHRRCRPNSEQIDATLIPGDRPSSGFRRHVAEPVDPFDCVGSLCAHQAGP